MVFSRRGQKHNKLSLHLRTSDPDGLLLWSNDGGITDTAKGDYLAVAVVGGYPEVKFKLGKTQAVTSIRSRVRYTRRH